jgi:hypothetical protein
MVFATEVRVFVPVLAKLELALHTSPKEEPRLLWTSCLCPHEDANALAFHEWDLLEWVFPFCRSPCAFSCFCGLNLAWSQSRHVKVPTLTSSLVLRAFLCLSLRRCRAATLFASGSAMIPPARPCATRSAPGPSARCSARSSPARSAMCTARSRPARSAAPSLCARRTTALSARPSAPPRFATRPASRLSPSAPPSARLLTATGSAASL